MIESKSLAVIETNSVNGENIVAVFRNYNTIRGSAGKCTRNRLDIFHGANHRPSNTHDRFRWRLWYHIQGSTVCYKLLSVLAFPGNFPAIINDALMIL
ncbi:hypothetical protein KUTeg_019300 [Tegillarca granosa]|uniref:Uncharacterized protein n=1 Tax=Tegillarca granosa TaxID=220873 RepID=A0ABQ9EC43_TEGGR|nr:hypothetical protein KUTeg_019300 [Tegillarca granosa]